MIVYRGCTVFIVLTLLAGPSTSYHSDENVIYPTGPDDCYGREYLRNPFDCRTYFMCEDGRLIYVVCPIGQYFNGVNRCSIDEPSDCTTSWYNPSTTTSTTSTSTTESPAAIVQRGQAPQWATAPPGDPASACYGQPDGATHKTSESGCDRYAVCWHGIAHSGQCAAGYSYNGVASVCDISNNHLCDVAICPPHGIHAFRLLGNCTAYNFCFAGAHRVRQCADGLQFDWRQQRCAQPEVARCHECPVLDDPDELVMFRAPRCDEYYICQNAEVVLFKCAAGLHWNDKSKQCELPDTARCQPQHSL